MTLHLEALKAAAQAALAEATGAWSGSDIATFTVFTQDPSEAHGRVLLHMNSHYPHKAVASYLAMLHPEAVLELIARMDSAAQRLVLEVDRLENELINATLVADAIPRQADTEAMLMRYIDNAKKAAGSERIAGEPVAEFITRILEELRALRAEVGS